MAEPELTCFNCDSLLVELRWPYLFCSELCKEEAKTVRYVRAVNRDGRSARPDVAEAVRIKIGMVLGGGYAASERTLSKDERQAIFDRDGGLCSVCGGEGTQIDHINLDAALVVRSINDPENLQTLCEKCHRKKTLSTFRPIGPEHAEKAHQLDERIDSSSALRVCDDEINWKTQWRKLASERTKLVRSMATE